jgi:hypothetical protein
MPRRMRAPSPALVIALIALFVSIAGGVGYAASKIGTNDIRNGAVTASKLHRKAVITNKIKGKAVTAGKLESTLKPRWAVVKADGTLARGRNVVSSQQVAGAGIYDVTFDRNVRNCAYVATVGRADDVVSEAGFPIVNRRPNKPKGVRVFIADKVGLGASFVKLGFHLQVEC